MIRLRRLLRLAVATAALLVIASGASASVRLWFFDSPDARQFPPTRLDRWLSDSRPLTPYSGGETNGSQCETQEFAGTYDAIQTLIWEGRGCTASQCHGSAMSGGLDLRRDASHGNLFDAASLGSPLSRVVPGDRSRSYLYSKLAAATFPGTVEITGAPMPNGLAPLTVDELDLVRLWITNGAPENGTIEGTEHLIDGCVPEPEPITIEPLPAPDPGDGVQVVMPPWHLPAESEDEVCFATYYDLSGTIPEQYLNEDGSSFLFDVMELRQDPQSHHLLLHYTPGFDVDPYHPSFGTWTCTGGANDGDECDPKDLGFCGEDGICSTAPESGAGCIGWGPPDAAQRWTQLGGAQQAIALLPFAEGVYAEFPVRGVLRWNSHAFNLTRFDTDINGRLNYTFADEQENRVRRIFNANSIFAANAAPFTRQEVCRPHVLPRGSRLFNLTSHTHKRGQRFRVWDGAFRCAGGANDGESCAPIQDADEAPDICAGAPCRATRDLFVGDCNGDERVVVSEVVTGVRINLGELATDVCANVDADGDSVVAVNELVMAVDTLLHGEAREIDRDPVETLIYTSFLYNDPLYAEYDPPREYDSDDRDLRTLTYCALYNNGVDGDGLPDLESVTRRSRTPENAFSPCPAVACVNDDMVGESCRSDADCDSSPGAGDGFCDACNITGGVSTENEMFILIGLYWVER